MSTPAQPAQSIDLAAGLHSMIETIQPIIEAAEGQKAALEARGWSPTAAEAYALELLLGMTKACFNTTGR